MPMPMPMDGTQQQQQQQTTRTDATTRAVTPFDAVGVGGLQGTAREAIELMKKHAGPSQARYNSGVGQTNGAAAAAAAEPAHLTSSTVTRPRRKPLTVRQFVQSVNSKRSSTKAKPTRNSIRSTNSGGKNDEAKDAAAATAMHAPHGRKRTRTIDHPSVAAARVRSLRTGMMANAPQLLNAKETVQRALAQSSPPQQHTAARQLQKTQQQPHQRQAGKNEIFLPWNVAGTAEYEHGGSEVNSSDITALVNGFAAYSQPATAGKRKNEALPVATRGGRSSHGFKSNIVAKSIRLREALNAFEVQVHRQGSRATSAAAVAAVEGDDMGGGAAGGGAVRVPMYRRRDGCDLPSANASSVNNLVDAAFDALVACSASSAVPALHVQACSVLRRFLWVRNRNGLEKGAHGSNGRRDAMLPALGAEKNGTSPNDLPAGESCMLTVYAAYQSLIADDAMRQQELSFLRKQCQEYHARLETAEQNARAAQAVKRQSERKADEALQQVQGHMRERNSLQSQAKLANSMVLDMNAELRAATDEIRNLKEEKLELEKQLLKAEASVEQAEGKFEDDDHVRDLKHKIELEEDRSMYLAGRLESSNKMYQSMHVGATKLAERQRELNREVERLKYENAELHASRETFLRPYTPRPNWEGIYEQSSGDGIAVSKQNKCEDRGEGGDDEDSADFDSHRMGVRVILDPLLQKVSASGMSTSGRVISLTHLLRKQCLATLAAQRQLQEMLQVHSKMRLRVAQVEGDLADALAVRPDAKDVAKPAEYLQFKSTSKYFVGLGVRGSIPAYLRTNRHVINRHFTKRECEEVVRLVWAEKEKRERTDVLVLARAAKTKHFSRDTFSSSAQMAEDEQQQPQLEMSLPEFFHVWLVEKYSVHSIVVEWGYNVLDALQRYRWDADCEMFLKVVTGDIVEEAYYDQRRLMMALRELFVYLEIMRSENKHGRLSAGRLEAALREFFPQKGSTALKSLVNAFNKSSQEDVRVQGDMSILFVETSTLSETEFVEEVRDQHLYEVENFGITLRQRLLRERNSVDGTISLQQIQTTWVNLDGNVSISRINEHIATALNIPVDEIGSMAAANTRYVAVDFMDDLLNKCLVKDEVNYSVQFLDRLAKKYPFVRDPHSKALNYDESTDTGGAGADSNAAFGSYDDAFMIKAMAAKRRAKREAVVRKLKSRTKRALVRFDYDPTEGVPSLLFSMPKRGPKYAATDVKRTHRENGDSVMGTSSDASSRRNSHVENRRRSSKRSQDSSRGSQQYGKPMVKPSTTFSGLSVSGSESHDSISHAMDSRRLSGSGTVIGSRRRSSHRRRADSIASLSPSVDPVAEEAHRDERLPSLTIGEGGGNEDNDNGCKDDNVAIFSLDDTPHSGKHRLRVQYFTDESPEALPKALQNSEKKPLRVSAAALAEVDQAAKEEQAKRDKVIAERGSDAVTDTSDAESTFSDFSDLSVDDVSHRLLAKAVPPQQSVVEEEL